MKIKFRILLACDYNIKMAEQNEKQKDLATIRTLKGDAEKYIKEKDVSLISIFSKKSRKETGDFKKEKRSKTISVIGTLIIAILVLAVFGLGYRIFFKPKGAVSPETIYFQR